MSTTTKKSYWLVKQEPSSYTWQQFLEDQVTVWDGVRNFQARNNLRAMKLHDQVLFYRSVEKPSVIGICEVVREAYPDPTAQEGDWSVVDLKATTTLTNEVSLQAVKSEPQLAEIPLLKQSRLSVMPLTAKAFRKLVSMSSGR